ncbi:hypothetical protein [Paenibacillus graminis]|uniref:hypothetical protein n=1 Tax=Paenibacillus graminis TaxID=189425 RepID=UPI0004B04641|nr:hypothetical protein [Paenibacillus graminis]
MHWKKATLGQLYEIAYNDEGAAAIYKRNAQAEIERRRQRRWGRVNHKIKAVYPK